MFFIHNFLTLVDVLKIFHFKRCNGVVDVIAAVGLYVMAVNFGCLANAAAMVAAASVIALCGKLA